MEIQFNLQRSFFFATKSHSQRLGYYYRTLKSAFEVFWSRHVLILPCLCAKSFIHGHFLREVMPVNRLVILCAIAGIAFVLLFLLLSYNSFVELSHHYLEQQRLGSIQKRFEASRNKTITQQLIALPRINTHHRSLESSARPRVLSVSTVEVGTLMPTLPEPQ